MNPVTTSAFDLPDNLAAKSDPTTDRRRRAALRGHRGEPRADDRRPVRPSRRHAQGARRQRPGGAGPGPGDPPADHSPAHPAPLRPGPVPRTHGQRGRLRARVRRTPRPHRQHRSPAADRLAFPRGRAVLRSDPRQPDGADEPPPVPLDPRPDQRLLGRGVHLGRVRRARARRSTTSPRSSPAWAATGRPGCATYSAPSRPIRTRSSARVRAAHSSSTAVRVRVRRSSLCTVRRTSCTPIHASVIGVAAYCSSVRTSLTWRTSPTYSPASARRACRPARCGTSSPRGRPHRTRPTRTSPG